MTIEYQIDDHTIMIADINKEDASFDHEFGTEKKSEYTVESPSVIVFINGVDYDITKALTANDLMEFENDFINFYKENIEYQLEDI